MIDLRDLCIISLPVYIPDKNDDLFEDYKALKQFVNRTRKDIVKQRISETILAIDPLFDGVTEELYIKQAFGTPKDIDERLNVQFIIPISYYNKLDFKNHNYSAAHIVRPYKPQTFIKNYDVEQLTDKKMNEKVTAQYYFVLFEDNHPYNELSENRKIIYNKEMPRQDYISWDEYFMGVASLTAMRSKDPKTQVGSCIVRDNKILSTGYNGFPLQCSDNDFSWQSENENPFKIKDLFVVHSELNAILNYKGDLTGSTIYVTLFPCNECAKAIIQSGIKRVVYKDIKESIKTIASMRMMTTAGVELVKYTQTNKKEIIEF